MTTLSEAITSTEKGEKTWHQERMIFEATERICELMDQRGISRTELARLLGKSKGYVTQLLDGTTNMTLRTLSDVFVALGRAGHITDSVLSVSNAPPLIYQLVDDEVEWSDPLESGTAQDEIPDTETSQPISQSVA